MRTKTAWTAAIAAVMAAAAPMAASATPVAVGLARSSTADADALLKVKDPPDHRSKPARDCRPYNGPYGYYGNPYCENGWKYDEDWDGNIVLWNWFDDPPPRRARAYRPR